MKTRSVPKKTVNTPIGKKGPRPQLELPANLKTIRASNVAATQASMATFLKTCKVTLADGAEANVVNADHDDPLSTALKGWKLTLRMDPRGEKDIYTNEEQLKRVYSGNLVTGDHVFYDHAHTPA